MLSKPTLSKKIILLMAILLQAIFWCHAQDTLLLSGRIYDINKEPLSGVSVSVEGVYSDQVISDKKGRFDVKLPTGREWLVIKPLGKYKEKSIFVNNRKELTIYLTPADLKSDYDEVTLINGSRVKRKLISSLSEVPAEKSFTIPIESIDQLFRGRVPGLFGTSHSGMPGSGVNTYIRGIKSLYTNNQPLYIIDGFPMESPGRFNSNIDGFVDNPLANLEPYDITSITILKDYLSTASYGMRASNGVVIIETLKPTEVQTSIDFAYKTGFTQKPEYIPQLNASQFKSLANELLFTSGIEEERAKGIYYPLYFQPGEDGYYDYAHNTNWQDLIFSDGMTNDFYLRVRGGDEIARYGLSVGYLNKEGVINSTDFSRFNVRFVGTFNIFKKLRMFVNSTLNTNDSEWRESARVPETSPILTSLFKAPILNPYQFDEDGQELITLADVGPFGVSNPVATTEKFEAGIRNYHFTTSARIEWDITNFIRWNSYLGLDLNSMTEAVFMPNAGMKLYYEEEVYNAAKSLKNYFNSIYTDHYISWEKKFSKVHWLQTVAGTRIQLNKFQVDWGIGKNSHERDEYKQLQDGTSYLQEMGGENAAWNRMTNYAMLHYGLLDRYFVSGSFSLDYSSRVGNKATNVQYLGSHPFGMFYSVGGAWRISGEPFFRNLSWLEDLKLRITYGLVGNDYIGNYSARSYYQMIHYRETTGMVPGPINDETVKFEENYQVNAGLDVALWAGRMDVTMDLFRIKTEDMLVFEPQSSFTGFSVIPVNHGEIVNKGYEIAVFSRLISGGRFILDIDMNLSRLQNSVEAIKDGEIINPIEGGTFVSRLGSPVINFYGYEYQGVFSSTEEAEAASLVNAQGLPFSAGDIRFNDISGPENFPDGKIDDYDKIIIGSPLPDYYGGFSVHAGFGRWGFDTDFQFVYGNEVFNYLRYRNECMTEPYNQSSAVLNRWFAEGQKTDIPRALWDDPVGNSSFSSRWIEDGSYLRIKNVILSYTIPDKFMFFRNMKIFITAGNLYTWSKYVGYDPEFSYSYRTMDQGIDYGLMPQTREYIIGIKLGL